MIQEGWFEVHAYDVILRPRQQGNVLLFKSKNDNLRTRAKVVSVEGNKWNQTCEPM
jgi:hypothetical protein